MGALPEGFLYVPEFLSIEEERELVDTISGLEFGEVRMHGVVAKRRVIHYGYLYTYDSARIAPGPPVPAWLEPLRERSAIHAGLAESRELAEALVTEYPPGAQIGWHRDAPPFGIVVAVSLGAPCRLRFRKGPAGARDTAEIAAEPRSLYILDGPARREWEHHVPAVEALRYSITFRTLRRKKT